MAFILFMVAGRWVGRSGVSKVTKHFVLFDTGSARLSVVRTGPWWCWWSRISHIRDDHENSHGRHVSNVWQCIAMLSSEKAPTSRVTMYDLLYEMIEQHYIKFDTKHNTFYQIKLKYTFHKMQWLLSPELLSRATGLKFKYVGVWPSCSKLALWPSNFDHKFCQYSQ